MPNNDELNNTTTSKETNAEEIGDAKETTTTTSQTRSPMIKGRDLLIYFSVKYNGDWNEISNAIKTRIKPDPEKVIETVKKVESSGVKTLTIIDEKYPKRLNFMTCPPFVLFYKGDVSLLADEHLLGIEVGNLIAKETTKIIKEVSESLNIISADSTITKGDFGVKVVVSSKGILKTSVNANLVISEAFDNSSSNVVYQSKGVLAGLSNALLVAGVESNSNNYETASHSLLLNHPILCFPDSIGKNSLGNALIKDGAILVETAEEIVDAYNYFK